SCRPNIRPFLLMPRPKRLCPATLAWAVHARPIWQSENFLSAGWFHTGVPKTNSLSALRRIFRRCEEDVGAGDRCQSIGENDRRVGRVMGRDITIRAVARATMCRS